MLTLGLTVIGAALVMFSALAKPEHIDPMGMFGLPPVRAARIGARLASCRAARSTARLSRRDAGWQCGLRSAAREAA